MPRSKRSRAAFLLISISAFGADFEVGKRAYERKDYATALKELTPLAEQGNPEAEVLLGKIESTSQGLPLDFDKALKWFKAAAEQGSADGQLQLGLLYLSGASGTKDTTEGLKWLKLSANQGNPDAQLNLGLVYRNASGVPHDYVEAWMWFQLAAQNGDPLAPRQRDGLRRFMTQAQFEQASAKAAAWKPTKQESRP